MPEKGLLEKVATIKRLDYPRLGSELKKQTSTAEKQYQRFDYDETVKIKGDIRSSVIKKHNRSNLVHTQSFTIGN